jgi:hypothetical protein
MISDWEVPPGSGKWKSEDKGKHYKKHKLQKDGTSNYGLRMQAR